ncbi:MAG: hypothetical protein EAX86_09595 [Candidatus Heimdallarchaeota archaeon]|nr:hypothetical protein [Candidatus Heimdallarchaeota archaeon]
MLIPFISLSNLTGINTFFVYDSSCPKPQEGNYLVNSGEIEFYGKIPREIAIEAAREIFIQFGA